MSNQTNPLPIHGYKVEELTIKEMVAELRELPYWQGVLKLRQAGFLPQFTLGQLGMGKPS